MIYVCSDLAMGLGVDGRSEEMVPESPLRFMLDRRELGVSYVIESSVRQWGDRVRMTAQLIRA